MQDLAMSTVTIEQYRRYYFPIFIQSNVETTRIYAYADVEMKRAAMEKANKNRSTSPDSSPVWQDNEEIILKLSGLK
jgi:hypothetical protein